MASMTYLVENHLLRTVRRYVVDVPLRHRFFTLSAYAALALATVVGLCVGLLSGLPDDGGTARSTLLAMAPVAWALVVTVSSPGRTLRTAFDSPRGWALLAGTPARPRDFAYGRYLLPEIAKAVVVSTAVLAATWGMVLSGAGSALPDAAGLAGVATGGIALGVVVRAALVLGGPARRLAGLPAWATRGVLLLVAGLVAVTYWLSGTSTAMAGLALAVALVAAGVVAWLADRRLARVDWADVSDVALRGQTVRHEAPALPERRSRAILAVDLRRLLRSADSRLRPVVNYVGLLVVLAVAAGGYALFGGTIALPPDLPRAELAAGLCAFAGYGASLSAASVLAMDADRHAYTLWSLVPGAMRAVASVRAAAGSLIVAGCGLAAVGAASAVLDLARRDVGLALVAVFTMAALAPVIELAGSLRWPELDWADATEIGTSTGARYVLGFTVGLPVAGALALARTVEVQPSTAHIVLAVIALPLIAPVIAAAVMSPVTRAVTRSSHA